MIITEKDEEKKENQRNNTLVLPTHEDYKYALSKLPNIVANSDDVHAQAHLVALTDDWIKFIELSLKTLPAETGPEQLDEESNQHAEIAIDESNQLEGYSLIAANLLYSEIFKEIQADKQSILEALVDKQKARDYIYKVNTIDAEKFLKKLGNNKPGKTSIGSLMRKIGGLRELYGRLPQLQESDDIKKKSSKLYALVAVLGVDEEERNITLATPYLYALALNLMREQIAPDKKALEELRLALRPKHEGKPTNTFLINTSIKNEPERVVELVFAIVTLIETAGSHKIDEEEWEDLGYSGKMPRRLGLASIAVETLINYCRLLRYDYNTMNRKALSKVIKTTFRAAGKALLTHTRLMEAYRDLILPDMSDIGLRDVNKVLTFRHYGKKYGKIRSR